MYLPVLVVAVLVVVGLAKDLKIHNIVVAVDLPPFTPNPTEITKVMIIGDSITQGYEGDYSWRYRIWQWFEKQKYSVDFVGPYAGTHSDYSSYEPSVNGGYAEDIEEDWDSDHFSLWGHTIWQFKDKIHQQVLIDEPDMLLVELGFNDMFWRGYSPPDILSLMKEFVDNARAAKPNIVLALADIPQMLDGDHGDIPITTDAYNVLLEKTIPEWSTELSPIKLVRFREHYTCGGKSCNSTHDGLHPNALGEFELAVAFSETLVELGIGKSAMVIPDKIPERPCPVPTNLHVETTEQGRQVTWDKVYGAFGYNVNERMIGTSDWSQYTVNTNWLSRDGNIDGMEYEVRCDNDKMGKSDWSLPVPAVQRPAIAPGGSRIMIHYGRSRFRRFEDVYLL